MISRTFRVALIIVLASFALSSAAWATCSNASLSGPYGFTTGGTNAAGAPVTHVSQFTFDPTTGTYTGESIASEGGVIITTPVTATYAVAANCTVTATVTTGSQSQNLAFVVTSTGFLAIDQKTGVISQGFGVKQGSPTCTNAGVEGSFGFNVAGVLLAGARGGVTVRRQGLFDSCYVAAVAVRGGVTVRRQGLFDSRESLRSLRVGPATV